MRIHMGRRMSIKSGSSPVHAEVQTSGFRHDRPRRISIPSARVRRPSLARVFRSGVGFLSLETVSLPGRQRSHDYNAIQRIDAESWGHTRGRRRVANPHRVRPARRRKRRIRSLRLRSLTSTSFDPRSHPLSPRERVNIRPASNVAVSDLHKVVNESPRYL